MHLLQFLVSFVTVFACTGVLAEVKEYNVYHRIHSPASTLEPTEFYLRGKLTLDTVPRLTQQSETFSAELDAFTAKAPVDALYQLALQRTGDEHVGRFAISSVKACHITPKSKETVVVHTTHDGEPFALDYFLSTTPHDGSCPPESTGSTANFSALANVNTTVLVRTPTVPPLPELRAPPQLSPEGTPVVPVPEKSFLQKYWVYILVILAALLLSGGAEEEPAKK